MMANIILFQPNHPSLLNLRAYEDYARTLLYGLRQLKYNSSILINSYDPLSQINFIFGGHLAPIETLSQLKTKTYFVNLEQYVDRDVNLDNLSDSFKFIVEKFIILDYSEFNIPFWKKIQPKYGVTILPVCYGENLILPQQRKEDIDVLYFGTLGTHFHGSGDYKMRFLHACTGKNSCKPRIAILQNDYDDLRNEFIMRSKIIISVTSDRVFPAVRTQLPIANRKAMVSSYNPTDLIPDFYKSNLIFSSIENIEECIHTLLDNSDKRIDYENRCCEEFKKTRIEDNLIRILR
jgi:hypothetical protein